MLRYNTGNWAFQVVADYRVIDKDGLASLYGNDIDSQRSQIMEFNYDLSCCLCQTMAFDSIPKTADFKILRIGHDEDPDEAMEKTEKYVVWRK